MKASTKIETQNDKVDAKKLYAEQLYQQQAAAKGRKERMMEMDRERANKQPPTEQEHITRKKDQSLLSKAQQQMDEEHDDVKHMNQMMLYSKVVTIRDK